MNCIVDVKLDDEKVRERESARFVRRRTRRTSSGGAEKLCFLRVCRQLGLETSRFFSLRRESLVEISVRPLVKVCSGLLSGILGSKRDLTFTSHCHTPPICMFPHEPFQCGSRSRSAASEPTGQR